MGKTSTEKELAEIKKERNRKEGLKKRALMLCFVVVGAGIYTSAANVGGGIALMAAVGTTLLVIGVLNLL